MRRTGARRTLALRRGEGGDAEVPALAPAPADVRTQAWLRPRGPRLLPGRGGWQLAAGGGGEEGTEEGGRERGGCSPPASVRRGFAPASKRKQSPAPPPRPPLPLLSQQRGVRHRVALRRASLLLASPRPAPPRRPCVECGETPRPGLALGAGHRRVGLWVPTMVSLWAETRAPRPHERGLGTAQVVVFAADPRDPAPSLNPVRKRPSRPP